MTFSNPILVNNAGANGTNAVEFADVAAGATATLASNVTATGKSQFRVGTTNSNSTLNVTGTLSGAGATTILTRGNVVFMGNGSLTSTNSIAVGRQATTTVTNVTVEDNAVIRGNGINLGGLNGGNDGTLSNITVTGNGLVDAGTGVFSLNNGDTKGATTLTLQQNGRKCGSSFAITGSNVGQATFEVDSGTITASANNTNFMPNSSHITFELTGPMTINDGGFNIGIAARTYRRTFWLWFDHEDRDRDGDAEIGDECLRRHDGFDGNAPDLAGGSALGSGTVHVNAGATFGGTGAVSNSVIVAGHLAPGAGATTGTLTAGGGVTLNGGSTLDINIASDGSSSSLLDINSGSLTNSGAGLDLYVAGTTNAFDLNGTYKLVTFDSGFVNPGFTSVANAVGGVTYTFSNDANSLFVTISGGLTSAAWAVDADGAWGSSGNWTGGVPNQVGAVANFGGVIQAARTVTISGSETVGQITFNNLNAYTVTGGTIVLDNGANGSALISDSLGNHTIASAVTLNSKLSVSTVAGNSVTLSGAVGGAGGLTANGAGTVVLAGANTYSGGTTVSAGTVKLAGSGTLGNVANALSIASGATLDMNGVSATVGSLSGAGTIDNVAGGGTSVLTTGGLNANITFSGVIKNTTGTVGLTKVGTGVLTLSGTNTFSGGVTLTGGELAVSAATNLGAATIPVNFNGGGLQVTGTTLTTLANPVTWSPAGGGFNIASSGNTLTVSSALSGGGLRKTGPGALVLSGAYNTTSPTTVTAGNLTLSRRREHIGAGFGRREPDGFGRDEGGTGVDRGGHPDECGDGYRRGAAGRGQPDEPGEQLHAGRVDGCVDGEPGFEREQAGR